MPPRPIHHWKSFWLGLFVAVFIGWAWWDSHHYFSRITWTGKGFAWNGGGQIAYSLFPQSVTNPFDLYAARSPLGSIRLEGITAKFKTIALPHSHLLATYLLLWSVFLIWRWQRMKRQAPWDRGPLAR